MKILTRRKRKAPALILASLSLMAATAFGQATFDISNTGFQYFVNGTNNTGTGMGSVSGTPTNNCPPLVLTAGTTNQFVVSVQSFHPFNIVTNAPGPSAVNYSGASPQAVTSSTMTVIIPATNYPTTLYYECSKHFFYGVINIVPPSPTSPPPNTIISIVVTPTGITVTSSGTNTSYTMVPQFNSNLVTGLWQDVPSYSNNFANGTNFTTFNRLDSLCGSNVFLRLTQRP